MIQAATILEANEADSGDTGPPGHLASGRPSAVVHVDLDGAKHIFRDKGWKYDYSDDPLFESGLTGLLDFLDVNRVRATLFAIADDLNDPRKRELLQEAVRRGHEVASHSLTHRRLARLSYEEKRVEIAESRDRLEAELGAPVTGFRAPSYDVDRDCLDLLDAYGYRFDSSTFPTATFADRMRLATVYGVPHRPFFDRSLIELPLPKYRPGLFPFHPCYSLILGNRHFQSGLRRFRRTEWPLVMLFHLTDLAAPLDRDRLPNWRAKYMTLSHLSAAIKRARCQTMLDRVKEDYALTDTASLLEREERKMQQTKPLILAISTTHETGAAVYEGAALKSAISEERLDRVKFSTTYPPKQSIIECIRMSGINPSEISEVVISGLPAGRLLPRMIRGQWRDFTEYHGVIDYVPHLNKVLYRAFYFYRALGYRSILRFLKKQYGIRPRIHFVEHHLCHAAAVYRTAPFGDALIVTSDGVGDDLSLTISEGRGGTIRRLGEVAYPHSFGQFYTACTQVLGFRGGRHEGKITGLSGFGKVDPALYAKVKSTIRRSGPNFTLDKRFYSEGIIRGLSLKKMRSGESLFDALQYRNYKTPLKRLVAGHPREDVAAVFQALLEEEMIAVVRPYAEKTGLKNLALCGGVFANVKLNNALFRALGMKELYIFPHMGDGGLSVGAALEFLQARPTPFDTVYWGPDFSESQMEDAIKAAAGKGVRYRREDDIERVIADHLVDGKVIARFNGPMEFGPRALCNRSILYRASDPSANKWLNDHLGRTEFMPFAPVALAERAEMLFKDLAGSEHACKFMTTILECTDYTKQNCPAIVHVDGTARPQLVTEEINPSAYRILKYYEERTGVPLLVNTSYNMHEEPIVCSPEDAVRAFLASRLDFLAMGPFIAWIEA